MNKSQRRKYVIPRKLHRNPKIQEKQIQKIEQVIIHNAYTENDIKEDFSRLNLKPLDYFPELSKEQHFWDGVAIHVVNPRGKTRLHRDIDQVAVLKEISGRNLELKINHKGGDEYFADLEFTKIAFNVAQNAITSLLKFQTKEQESINIIMGPHSFTPMKNIVQKNNNDYLSFRVLNINNKIALHFNDPFGGQAHDVLNQLYKAIDAYYSGLPINLFHFGKVGALAENSEVKDIFLPTGAMSEKKLILGDDSKITFRNEWCDNNNYKLLQTILNESFEENNKRIHSGTTVNSTSVLQQRISSLKKISEYKPVCIDMELEEILKSTPNYSNKLNIFASYVASDKPPKITLAENQPTKKEQEALFNASVEYIKEN